MVDFTLALFVKIANWQSYFLTIVIPYKTIYWRGINIGDWQLFRKFNNIKIANINMYMDTPTKPLQKLEKKDMVAQIANIKSVNCFL